MGGENWTGVLVICYEKKRLFLCYHEFDISLILD